MKDMLGEDVLPGDLLQLINNPEGLDYNWYTCYLITENGSDGIFTNKDEVIRAYLYKIINWKLVSSIFRERCIYEES